MDIEDGGYGFSGLGSGAGVLLVRLARRPRYGGEYGSGTKGRLGFEVVGVGGRFKREGWH